MRGLIIILWLTLAAGQNAIADCRCDGQRECDDCYYKRRCCQKQPCKPQHEPLRAPVPEETPPEREGAFAAPPQQGPVAGESETFGIEGPAINVPPMNFRFPTIQLPSIFRVRNNARMMLPEANAPFVENTAQLNGLMRLPEERAPLRGPMPPPEQLRTPEPDRAPPAPCPPPRCQPRREPACSLTQLELLRQLEACQNSEREILLALEGLDSSEGAMSGGGMNSGAQAPVARAGFVAPNENFNGQPGAMPPAQGNNRSTELRFADEYGHQQAPQGGPNTPQLAEIEDQIRRLQGMLSSLAQQSNVEQSGYAAADSVQPQPLPRLAGIETSASGVRRTAYAVEAPRAVIRGVVPVISPEDFNRPTRSVFPPPR